MPKSRTLNQGNWEFHSEFCVIILSLCPCGSTIMWSIACKVIYFSFVYFHRWWRHCRKVYMISKISEMNIVGSIIIYKRKLLWSRIWGLWQNPYVANKYRFVCIFWFFIWWTFKTWYLFAIYQFNYMYHHLLSISYLLSHYFWKSINKWRNGGDLKLCLFFFVIALAHSANFKSVPFHHLLMDFQK